MWWIALKLAFSNLVGAAVVSSILYILYKVFPVAAVGILFSFIPEALGKHYIATLIRYCLIFVCLQVLFS